MTCDDVIARGLAEDYVLGRLGDAERDAFEHHYFECARCFAEVRAIQEVQELLRRPAAAAPARQAFPWVWLAAAAGIVVALSAALLWVIAGPGDSDAPREATIGRPAPSDPQPTTPAPAVIAELARVEPPPYEPRRLRSAAPSREFTAGMARYQAGDHAGAIPLLESAVAADAAFEPARFYLGASQLLAGRAAAAVATLRPLTIGGDSPFAEEARFLTAKAHLQEGDTARAVSALDATIALEGERQAEALRIKDALRSVR